MVKYIEVSDNLLYYISEMAYEQILQRVPAADVRPVVLYRNCNCYKQSHYIDNHMKCTRSGFPVHSVDFCSYGKKKEKN